MCIRDRYQGDRQEPNKATERVDMRSFMEYLKQSHEDFSKKMEELKTDNKQSIEELKTDNKPVSYTHLDVYKRQLLQSATFN